MISNSAKKIKQHSNKKMGLWSCIFIIMGNTIGAGILALPAATAKYGNVSIYAWPLAAFGGIMLAFVFASLAKKYPQTGGPYVYCSNVFGRLVGFQMAWNYWFANWISNALLCFAFVGYIKALTPLHYVLQLCGECFGSKITDVFIALMALWSLTFVNIQGINLFDKLQRFMTIAKILPMIILCVFCFPAIDSSNLISLNTGVAANIPQSILASLPLVFFAFLGIESASIPANHVKNPDITIPKATILGALLVAAFYMLISVVIFGVADISALSKSSAPFALVIQKVMGDKMTILVAALAAFACFSTLNGWILLQGQTPKAAALDGLFPKIFAKDNKNGVPGYGIAITSVLCSLLIFFSYRMNMVEQVEFVAEFSIVLFLITYVYSTIANMVVNKTKRGIITSMFAFCLVLLAIWGVGAKMVLLGFFVSLIGLPIYAFTNTDH